ncbi:MAG TPA: undecaprenyl-diphosphate phosphatase [Aggregatilineaceae bacterium]|nr:undecaprenyl-diphosphate phosphatase [Aggregatilineaceae bacterium]
MEFIASIVLGAVLGITEFMPISSLGHSLVLAAIFNFPPTADGRNTMAIFIQLGAVLAVLVYYFRPLVQELVRIPSDQTARRFWVNIIIAFVPIGVLGLVFNDFIKRVLFQPIIVGLALIVGGITFLLVEQRKYYPDVHALENITPRQALTVGFAQIFALIPGISRSGATIVGGLLCGLDRSVATLFTFYLFIPTLGAAAGYELFKTLRQQPDYFRPLLPYFLLATAVGFVVSLGAIRFLLRYIANHDFRPFGIYRIIIGAVIIVLVLAQAIH